MEIKTDISLIGIFIKTIFERMLWKEQKCYYYIKWTTYIVLEIRERTHSGEKNERNELEILLITHSLCCNPTDYGYLYTSHILDTTS